MLEPFPPSFQSPTQWVFAGLVPEEGALRSLAEPCQALPGFKGDQYSF